MRRTLDVVFAVVVALAIGGYLVLQTGAGEGRAGAVERLLTMRNNRYVLEGWRHQGPGGFNLDSTAGVLKSYGGMGLLWYSAKQYGDFTLELDFRCADSATNSGVFLRVPGEWNHFAITFRGSNITVVLNDKRVVDWDAVPRGKVRDFVPRGYIGLQNHDDRSPVEFRNILIKELT